MKDRIIKFFDNDIAFLALVILAIIIAAELILLG